MEVVLAVILGSLMLLGFYKCDMAMDQSKRHYDEMEDRCQVTCAPHIGHWLNGEDCICDPKYKKKIDSNHKSGGKDE